MPGTQRALAGRGREARFPGSKAVDACLVLRPRDERGARGIPTTQACQPGPAIGHRAAAPLPEDSVDPEGALQPPETVAFRATGHRQGPLRARTPSARCRAIAGGAGLG